jgi:hypothetical protein
VFAFPLATMREREESRRLKTGADAGDIDPGAIVGSTPLSSGGWDFMVGADLMSMLRWQIPVTDAGLGRRRQQGSSLAWTMSSWWDL